MRSGSYQTSEKAKLSAVNYSQARGARFIKEFNGSLMYGPDLYQVKVDDKVEINLWQPMHMPQTVEVVECASLSHFVVVCVPASANVPECLRKQMLSMIRNKYGQDVLPTFALLPIYAVKGAPLKHVNILLSLY